MTEAEAPHLPTVLTPLDLTVPIVSGSLEHSYCSYYRIDFEHRYRDVEHYFGAICAGQYQIASHFYDLAGAQGSAIIVHGYYDHSGLFRHLIDYCLSRGYSVLVFDLPGHGLSSGRRASIGDFSDYQQVLAAVLNYVQPRAAGPWLGLAQSTGGAILAEYQLATAESVFERLVLLAPLLYPVRWKTSLLAYKLLHRLIDKIPRGFSNNSHDGEFLEFLRSADPLQADHLPLEWVGALARWIAHIRQLPASVAAPLIIQGDNDDTVDWEKNMPLYQQLFPDASIHLLAGAKHQLVNERADIRGQVSALIDDYLGVVERVAGADPE